MQPGFMSSPMLTTKSSTLELLPICEPEFGNIKRNRINSYTSKYNIYKLVYFEGFELIIDAIARESYIKNQMLVRFPAPLQEFRQPLSLLFMNTGKRLNHDALVDCLLPNASETVLAH
jgi:hypothetical protein